MRRGIILLNSIVSLIKKMKINNDHFHSAQLVREDIASLKLDLHVVVRDKIKAFPGPLTPEEDMEVAAIWKNCQSAYKDKGDSY